MSKIAFDKYYSPPTVARWCIDKAKEIIGEENITEWVEPSAGSGSFSHQIPGCKAYDLYPQSEYIEQADFTKLDMGGYKKGRMFIGNPPFGAGTGKLIKEFYNKCCKDGDYIAFILPANYYWNYKRLYKFEIVYSVMIETPYTNELLKTSFTIYKRNPDKDDWRENKVPELEDVKIVKYNKTNKKGAKLTKIQPYDYCFKVYGSPMFGESEPYRHVSTYAISVAPHIRYEVISCIKYLEKRNRETGFLQQKQITQAVFPVEDLIKLLKICIPEIK